MKKKEKRILRFKKKKILTALFGLLLWLSISKMICRA
jgi:hypothetical protein